MQDPLTPEWRRKVDAAAAIVVREMDNGEEVPGEPSRAPLSNHSSAQLTEKQIDVLRRVSNGQKQRDIAKDYGVDATNISGIVGVLRIRGHLPLKARRRK